MARLVLTPRGEGRVRAGHPWVYRADVIRLDGGWTPEQALTVTDGRGHVLGRGFYNPRPQIVCRLLTRVDEPVDAAFFMRRLEAAWRYRQALGRDGDAGRVVAGDADRLPGLVIDRYADVGVLQPLTFGMAQHARGLAETVAAIVGLRAVYCRPDPAAAAIERIEAAAGWLIGSGDPAAEVEIREGPCRFQVAVVDGQKTGFYLDQRDNREAVARHAAGRDVLDAFCYTGAFAAWALHAGAARVLAVDSSPDACRRVRLHADLSGAGARCEVREANAFDCLRELEREGRRFDLVILDPPSFTRRRAAVEGALRGYKEINLRAVRCLRPGGLLATFSCSHHVSPALFEEVCRAAAADVGRPVRLRATYTQAPDHPVLLTVPETRYLTGFLLEVLE